MEGLAAAEGRCQSLDGNADDIVFWLLRGERRTGRLRMEAEEERTWVFRVETVAYDFGPEAAGGTVLGDLFEEVAVSVEEKGELRGKFVDGEAGVERGLDVGDAVGQCEGDFLDGRRSGFANVVAGDGDGVPLGEIVAAPREDVGDDAHGGTGGIDVGATGDVFLEDVVLYCAGNFCEVGALLFGDGDVKAEEDGGGGVDGHRGRDSFERDIIEESFHVFE